MSSNFFIKLIGDLKLLLFSTNRLNFDVLKIKSSRSLHSVERKKERKNFFIFFTPYTVYVNISELILNSTGGHHYDTMH